MDSLDGGVMSPWGSDEDADGGTMQPWTIVADIDGGLGLNYLCERVSRTTVASEDIKITGVRVYVPDTVEEFEFATVGTNGYILALTDNPLVSASNMTRIANAIYSVVGGARFRPFDASIWGDPSIEAGDTIGIYDYLGHLYISYITNMSYPLNGLLDIECGAETVSDRENEYSNPQTSTIQSAVTAAYDYIQAKKISADYISAGTIEADVVAKNFTMEGGTIKIDSDSETKDFVQLNYDYNTIGLDAEVFTKLQPNGLNVERTVRGNSNYVGSGVYSESNVYLTRTETSGYKASSLSHSALTFWNSNNKTPIQLYSHFEYGMMAITDADGVTNIALQGSNGTVTAASFVNSSRLDLKENLKKVDSVLDKIKSADILEFNFKTDEKKHIGLAIGGEYNVPEEVIATDEDGEEQGVDLYSMVSMAWKAIQEQQTIIEELEKRIEVLEKKLIGTIKVKGDTDGNTD